jgi:hypothetical protein
MSGPDTTPVAMTGDDLDVDDMPATEITPLKAAGRVPVVTAAPISLSSDAGAPAGGDPPDDGKLALRPSAANLPSASTSLPSAPTRSRTPLYVSIGVAGAAVVALVVVVVVGRSPTPPAAPTTAATPPPQPAPAGPTTAKLEVIVTPVDAQLTLDGRALGANPFVGALARDGQVHDLKVSASGFETLSRRFVMDQDVMLQLALQPTRPAAAAAAQAPAPTAAAAAAPAATPSAVASRPPSRPSAPGRQPAVARQAATLAATPPAAVTPPAPTPPAAVATTPPSATTPTTTASSKRSLDNNGYDSGSNKRSLDTDVYDTSNKTKPTIDRENPWKK